MKRPSRIFKSFRWQPLKENAKQGSLIVDAACILPVFILSFALIISLIIRCAEEDNVYHKIAMASQKATQSYIATNTFALALGQGAYFTYWRSEHLDSSNTDLDKLVTACSTVHSSFGIPDGKIRVIFRPFVGEQKSDGDVDLFSVYIFPKAGERYHIEGCSVLTRSSTDEGDYIRVTRSEAKDLGYTPCKLCLPQ